MLTGIKVQITAESSIVIGRLCCYLQFCPGQNDKLPVVCTSTRVRGRIHSQVILLYMKDCIGDSFHQLAHIFILSMALPTNATTEQRNTYYTLM